MPPELQAALIGLGVTCLGAIGSIVGGIAYYRYQHSRTTAKTEQDKADYDKRLQELEVRERELIVRTATRDEANNGEIRRLYDSLIEEVRKSAQANARIDQLRKDVTALEEKLTQRDERLRALSADFSRAQQDSADQMKAMRQEIEQLTAMSADLRSQREALYTENKELRTERTTLIETNAKLKAQVDSLQERTSRLETELAEARNKLNALEALRLPPAPSPVSSAVRTGGEG